MYKFVLPILILVLSTRQYFERFVQPEYALIGVYAMASIILIKNLARLSVQSRLALSISEKFGGREALWLLAILQTLLWFRLGIDSIWRQLIPQQLFILIWLLVMSIVCPTFSLYALKRPIALTIVGMTCFSAVSSALGVAPGPQGIFGHHNTAAFFCCIALSATPLINTRSLRIFSTIASLYSGILSDSETFKLALPLIIPVLVLGWVKLPSTYAAGLSRIILFVTAFASFLPMCSVYFDSLNRIMTDFAVAASSVSRIEVWRLALNVFAENPFFGYGDERIFHVSVTGFGFSEDLLYAHNAWLTYLGVSGLIGTFLFLLIFFRTTVVAPPEGSSMRLALAVVVVFSTIEYALQIDFVTWIIFIIFGSQVDIRKPTEKKPSLK